MYGKVAVPFVVVYHDTSKYIYSDFESVCPYPGYDNQLSTLIHPLLPTYLLCIVYLTMACTFSLIPQYLSLELQSIGLLIVH